MLYKSVLTVAIATFLAGVFVSHSMPETNVKGMMLICTALIVGSISALMYVIENKK